MRAAIVFGSVTGDAPVSYWLSYWSVLEIVPELFAKVISAQFPYLF